ncbi:hypothetical protein SBA3_4100009 [Candidatus Sulfopaludibacter sp. SbA3]|nr:hypothetical protein SBA3_4100009 [Candidatus Sulfopaludibacter sp. SbA3]
MTPIASFTAAKTPLADARVETTQRCGGSKGETCWKLFA